MGIEDVRAALIEADHVAQMVYNGLAQVLDATGIEALRQKGMDIYYPTPAEYKSFQDVAIPYVRKYMEQKVGATFVKDFLQSIDDISNQMQQEAAK